MDYTEQVKLELMRWRQEMQKKPGMAEKASKRVQTQLNKLWPKTFHDVVTKAIKEMTKTVITGSEYTATPPQIGISLQQRDEMARELTKKYKYVAMAEGAGTGAGGLVMGIADFPLLLSIKVKLLYEIAAIYGFNIKDYKERVYILSIFELAFSSQEHVNEVFKRIERWPMYKKTLPEYADEFDWRKFQQEYRDYLDLAKLMQMLPFIGAPIGAYVNSKLVRKLSETAIQAYRMRWIQGY